MRNKKLFSNFILLLLIFCLNAGGTKSKAPVLRKVRLDLAHTIGKGVLNYPGLPGLGYNLIALDENCLYLYDSRGKFPFYALELTTLKLKGFGSWGSGPGELNMGVPVILSSTKPNLVVYIPFEMRILLFRKENLQLLKEIKAGETFKLMSSFYMIRDTLGIYSSSSPEPDSASFGTAFQIEESGKILPASINYGKYDNLSKLIPLRENPMLKKGPFHSDGENIYFAHYYSSLLLGFSIRGETIFATFEPRKIAIPEARIKNVGGIISGDPERSIQCYLSLTSDERYLYALFSGEELSFDKIMAYRSGRKDIDIHLGEGRIVDVFGKKDGKYQFSFELPVFAVGIASSKDYLFVATVEDEPCLLIFKKSGF